MSEHAFLAPSAAAIWVVCAGAPTLMQLFPGEETQDSRDGSASHWAASEMLYGRPVAIGQVADNGVTLNDEMIEGAEMYVDTIDETLQSCGFVTRENLIVEERVRIPYVHPTLNWGTPDCRAFLHYPSTGRATLYVWDYKFGFGFVDVFENWQLIDYTSGILDGAGIDGLADQYIDVVFCIVQPRSYHKDGPVRYWRIGAAELRPYFNKLHNAAGLATAPNPVCTPNNQCEHCSGRFACEAIQQAAYKSCDLTGASIPVEMSGAALGLELTILQRAANRLKARITGLEEQTLLRLKGGELVPGFATEDTYGRENWTKPVDEVIALGSLFGKDLAKPGVITPKQAIKAGVPAEIISAGYAERAGTGRKLVADNGTLARKIFGK